MQVDKSLAMSSPYLLNDKFPCKYEVLDAKETVLPDESKTAMITLKLRVTDNDGKSAILRAWLKWHPDSYHEIGAYCISSQMETELDMGELKDTKCIGKKGDCLIKNVTNRKSGSLESQIKKWLPSQKESNLSNNDVLWG